MARINIEDSLYKDGRFTELCIKLEAKWTALGALLEAWTLAQDFVTIENPEGLAPLEIWKKRKICDLIIEVGLGEVRGDQVYLCGAKEQFNWLVQAKIKGKKGGQAQLKPSLAQLNPSSSPTNPLPLYSSSLKEIQEEESAPARDEPQPPPPPPDLPLEGFGAIEELSHGLFLSAALVAIPRAVQASWLDRYDTIWLKEALTHAIEYHLTKAGKRWPNGVSDWGKKFDSWLAREENPIFKSRPRARAAPAEIQIPVLSAEEILCSASKVKLGPGAKLALARSLGLNTA